MTPLAHTTGTASPLCVLYRFSHHRDCPTFPPPVQEVEAVKQGSARLGRYRKILQKWRGTAT